MRGVFQITQCTSFQGATGGCDTSEFQISDLHYGNMMGTTTTSEIASLQCSGAVPCPGIDISNVTLRIVGSSTIADEFDCSNVVDPIGFSCTSS
jgi:hypothetical protein